MSTQTPSRSTLQTVLDTVGTDPGLTSRQRQDMLSAVRTIARVLGSSPDMVTLDVQSLRRRLENLSPHSHGLSPGRWNNVRSLFNRSVELVRPLMAARSFAPIRSDWTALLGLMTVHRSTRLKPLLRYLSERQVGPAAVTLAMLEDYRRGILEDRLRANAEKTWTSLVWAWEANARDVPGWPEVAFKKTVRAERYSLPWTHFPASLKDAVDGYLRRLARDVFDEDGPPRPARPETLRHREYQLRSFASALVLSGVPAAELIDLAALLRLDRVEIGLRWYHERARKVVTSRVSQLRDLLKGVLRHSLKADEPTLRAFDHKTRRLVVRSRTLTPKNRARLRQFDDPRNVETFLALPACLQAEVKRGGMSARSIAVLASHAAGIAILQVAPLRRQNLAMIELGRHLIRSGPRWLLIFEPDETKGHDRLEFELPAHTVAILDWYVTQYRPRLAGEGCKALFPGEGGGAKAKSTLGLQIKDVVFKYTGLTVNVHLFRHTLAKIFLELAPGNIEVIRQVLGHKSIATTMAFYCGTEGREASRHFADIIERARRSKAPQATAPRQQPRPKRNQKP
jgi:integrase